MSFFGPCLVGVESHFILQLPKTISVCKFPLMTSISYQAGVASLFLQSLLPSAYRIDFQSQGPSLDLCVLTTLWCKLSWTIYTLGRICCQAHTWRVRWLRFRPPTLQAASGSCNLIWFVRPTKHTLVLLFLMWGLFSPCLTQYCLAGCYQTHTWA